MNQVNFNIKAHDKIAKRYEKMHTEIYNDIEQKRLKKALEEAVSSIDSGCKKIKALDFGSGAGNLTSILLDLGVEVTAADVSTTFLKLIKHKHPSVHTHVLNGKDMSEIPDASYDIVATYSVLHHVPDYLAAVSEMCRVLKPGGVLYIDHEKNESYWNCEPKLNEFYRSQRWALLPNKLKRLLSPAWYVHRFRRLKDSRYQAEGDIHVWPDDHVQWSEVIAAAENFCVRPFKVDEFLLYDEKYNSSKYAEASTTIFDTKAVTFMKYAK